MVLPVSFIQDLPLNHSIRKKGGREDFFFFKSVLFFQKLKKLLFLVCINVLIRISVIYNSLEHSLLLAEEPVGHDLLVNTVHSSHI